MNKFLVPLDFSAPADNALDYAICLARKTGASLLLYHVIYMQDPLLLAAEELEQEIRQSLQATMHAVIERNPDLHVTYAISYGIPADEIRAFAKSEKPDLIIMGAQGAGYVGEKLLGSTASTLIRKTKIPVLIIDRRVRYKELKQVVLSTDFEETDDANVLAPLRKLANVYDFHIVVLNISSGLELIPSLNKTWESFRLEHTLKDFRHTFFYTENAQVVQGINDFVEKKKMDMVIMVARKHSFISRLFREPKTKSMTFHSKVPLLVLHE